MSKFDDSRWLTGLTFFGILTVAHSLGAAQEPGKEFAHAPSLGSALALPSAPLQSIPAAPAQTNSTAPAESSPPAPASTPQASDAPKQSQVVLPSEDLTLDEAKKIMAGT